jgi:hypothetical protein
MRDVRTTFWNASTSQAMVILPIKARVSRVGSEARTDHNAELGLPYVFDRHFSKSENIIRFHSKIDESPTIGRRKKYFNRLV